MNHGLTVVITCERCVSGIRGSYEIEQLQRRRDGLPGTPSWLVPRRPRVTKGIVRSMLKSAGMRAAIETGKVSDEKFDWMVALLRDTDTFGNESRYNPRPIGLRGPVDAVRHPPELLSRVTSPVHMFWGSDDRFGGRDSAEELAGLLPRATLQMVTVPGHAPVAR